MIKKFTVYAVVTARGGSKGIPGKNLKRLAGKPLIAHPINAGLKSKFTDLVFVSTDSSKIARIAKKFGAQVPFLRPAQLARDNTPDYPVFQHFLSWLKKNRVEYPDILVHLRPTGPFVTARQIDDALKLLVERKGTDSVRTVHEAEHTPYKMWAVKNGVMKPLLTVKGLRESFTAPRQALPKAFRTNPNVGAFWTKTVLKKKSILGTTIRPLLLTGPVIDIDTPADFAAAENHGKKS